VAYNEQLADSIREHLAAFSDMEEKEMMGGLAFMYNGKMCVGVIKDDLMCRIDPDIYETALEKEGCRAMDFTGRPMKGWVFVSEEAIKSKKNLDYWLRLALDFNKKAKPFRKKKR